LISILILIALLLANLQSIKSFLWPNLRCCFKLTFLILMKLISDLVPAIRQCYSVKLAAFFWKVDFINIQNSLLSNFQEHMLLKLILFGCLCILIKLMLVNKQSLHQSHIKSIRHPYYCLLLIGFKKYLALVLYDWWILLEFVKFGQAPHIQQNQIYFGIRLQGFLIPL